MLEVTAYNVETLGKDTIEEYPNDQRQQAVDRAIEVASTAPSNHRIIVMSDGWLPIFEPTPNHYNQEVFL